MTTKMENTMEINVVAEDTKAIRARDIVDTTPEIGGIRVAFVAIDLYEVDYSYQRVLTTQVNYLTDNFKIANCGTLDVSYRDGRFYIIDGQHRYYAARANGIEKLLCIIRTGLTAEDEARIFVELNKTRKKPSPFDIFKANIRNGDESIPDVKVDMIIKKVCDKHKVDVKQSTDSYKTHILRSLDRARDIVTSKNLGEKCLDWMLDLITTEDKWSECQEAYRSYTMTMLKTFYVENIENIEVETERLKKLMGRLSPTEMLKLANDYRKKYECTTGAAMSMVLKELI